VTDRRPETEPELIEFVRAIDVRAPSALHDQVGALVAAAEGDERARSRALRWWPSRQPRTRAVGAVALALCVALALVLALRGGSSPTPTVDSAAALAAAPATAAAPLQSSSHSGRLTAAVGTVAFPYWQDSLGWRATGTRNDVLDGRASTTVFYTSAHGKTVAYTILAGAPARGGMGRGVSVVRGGTPYHLLSVRGLNVVSWRRDGDTCVLAARDVSYHTLLYLASWTA